MSDREKKLLFSLLGALFIIANFFAYSNFYEPRIKDAEKRKKVAEATLAQSQAIMSQKADWEKTRSWLQRAEGQPTTYQTASSKLQSFVKRSADRRGLITKKEDILDQVKGANYDRVRVRFRVNGLEQQIQQWILEIHRPQQLQVITKFDLKPQKNDLTRADCEIEIEQWFIPAEES